MKPRFPNKDADGSVPGLGSPPADETLSASPARRADLACCCPAQPLVRVVMPPTTQRRHSVDLLLCGHHYRVSRQALMAAGARIEDLPGRAEAAAAALLQPAHRDHVGVG